MFISIDRPSGEKRAPPPAFHSIPSHSLSAYFVLAFSLLHSFTHLNQIKMYLPRGNDGFVGDDFGDYSHDLVMMNEEITQCSMFVFETVELRRKEVEWYFIIVALFRLLVFLFSGWQTDVKNIQYTFFVSLPIAPYRSLRTYRTAQRDIQIMWIASKIILNLQSAPHPSQTFDTAGGRQWFVHHLKPHVWNPLTFNWITSMILITLFGWRIVWH